MVFFFRDSKTEDIVLCSIKNSRPVEVEIFILFVKLQAASEEDMLTGN